MNLFLPQTELKYKSNRGMHHRLFRPDPEPSRKQNPFVIADGSEERGHPAQNSTPYAATTKKRHFNTVNSNSELPTKVGKDENYSMGCI